jgi:hypothetical protein
LKGKILNLNNFVFEIERESKDFVISEVRRVRASPPHTLANNSFILKYNSIY